MDWTRWQHRLGGFRRRQAPAGPEEAGPGPDDRRGEEEIAMECEAFLSGTYLDWLACRREPVPAWVWLNTLAHGAESDIEALAARTADEEHPASVVVALARAALHCARRTGMSLASLQQSVLVPIESTLYVLGGQESVESAGELAGWIGLVLGRRSMRP